MKTINNFIHRKMYFTMNRPSLVFLCLAAILLFFENLEAQTISYIPKITQSALSSKATNVNLPVGRIDANASAANGNSSYTIPISIPNGTNGVSPSLAVSYSSSGSDGILGAGWGVSGLSVISRSNKTIYHDGAISQFNFSSTDAFNWDGKRFTYNPSTSSYQLEVEEFTKIEVLSGTPSNPSSFKVTTKDGTVFEYGTTTESKLIHTSENVISWMLTKMSQPDGNYIEYNYIKTNNEISIDEINYTGNSEANITPYNKVKFNYLERADANTVYVAGLPVSNSRLLDNIQIKAENVLFKSYEFKYALVDEVYSQLAEIKEKGALGAEFNSTIFKYGDLPVTALAYKEEQIHNVDDGYQSDLFAGDFNGDGFSDMLSVRYVTATSSGRTIKTYNRIDARLNDGNNGVHTMNSYWSKTLSYNEQLVINRDNQSSLNFYVSDYDGDGLDDFALFKFEHVSGYGSRRIREIKSIDIYRSTGTGFELWRSIAPNTNSSYRYVIGENDFIYVGDFDGDARQDVVMILKEYNAGAKAFITFPAKMIDFQEITNLSSADAGAWITSALLRAMDFNGDGKNELAVLNNNVLKLYEFNNNNGIWGANTLLSDATSFNDRNLIYFGDFNGDRKTDLLVRGDKTVIGSPWSIRYSDGSSFTRVSGVPFNTRSSGLSIITTPTGHSVSTAPTYIPPSILFKYNNGYPELDPSSFTEHSELFISDYNQDGKQDILHLYYQNNPYTTNPASGCYEVREVYYSVGNSNFEQKELGRWFFHPSVQLPLINREHLSADFNGDGRSDFLEKCLRFGSYGPYQLVTINENKQDRLLQATKDGFGLIHSWQYELMNQCRNVIFWNPVNKFAQTGGGDTGGGDTPSPVSLCFYTRTKSLEHPVNTIKLPIPLVKQFTTSDAEGYSTLEYRYQDAIIHKEGKGFLGFETTKSRVSNFSSATQSGNTDMISVSNNVLNSTYYSLIPEGGLTEAPYNSSTAVLNRSKVNFEFVPLGDKRYWMKTLSEETEAPFDDKYSRTDNVYDDFGNLTTKTTFVAPLADKANIIESTQITTDYQPFANTIPNKPISVTNTSYRQGQTSETQTVWFDYTTMGQSKTKIVYENSPNKVVTDYTYWPDGNVKGKTITTPNAPLQPNGTPLPSLYEEYTYDDLGRAVTEHKNTLGQTDMVAENHVLWGKPTSVTDLNGFITTYTYDEFGQPQTTTSTLGTVTESNEWAIDATEKTVFLRKVVATNRPTTKSYFDMLERERKAILEEKDHAGVVTPICTKKTYNESGQVATITKPFKPTETPFVTTNTYDLLQRLIKGSNPIGEINISYLNYAMGVSAVVTTDMAGKVTAKVTDAAGKIIRSTDNGGTLNFTYDSRGNNIEVSSNGKVLVSKKYDAYGNRSELNDLSAGKTLYEYNAFGALATETTATGKRKMFSYNALAQIAQKNIDEGRIDYEYYPASSGANNVNKLKNVFVSWLKCGGAPAETYTYDPLGRLETKTFKADLDLTTAQTTTYEYDPQGGNLKSVLYPSGVGLFYDYYPDGRLFTIKNYDQTQLLYQLNENNGSADVTSYTLGNGKSSTVTYQYGFPIQYQTPNTASTFIQNLTMGWSDYKTGNLYSRADLYAAETFVYDNLDRLKQADTRLVTQSTILNSNTVDYELNGNITTKSEAGTYFYPSGKNALARVSNPNVWASNINQDITYSSFFQPLSIKEGNFSLSYEYGEDLQRIKGILREKNALGVEAVKNTRYYFDGYEINIENNVTQYIHYVSSPSGLISIIVKENTNAPDYYFTYTDHLGSILSVTDKNGTIIAQQNFDAWGRKRDPYTLLYTGIPATPSWLYRGYTGHEHLPQFGLINMNGRLYDPVLGRMLSPDNNIQEGFNTQNYNRYSYVLNNPLKFNDPSGEFWHIVAGAAINLGINLVMGNVHDLGDVLYYAGTGALAAAIPMGAGAGALIGGGAALGAATALSDYAYGAVRGRYAFDTGSALKSMAFGAGVGAAFGTARYFIGKGKAPKPNGKGPTEPKTGSSKVPKVSDGSTDATTAIDGGANTRLDPNATTPPDGSYTATGDEIVYTYKSPSNGVPKLSPFMSLGQSIIQGSKQLKWIMDKHGPNQLSKYADKSKFFISSQDELQTLIQNSTHMRPMVQANGNILRTVDVGRTIGFDVTMGKSTSIYSVITNPNGNLITAFPGLP